jgi:hypothetical protein
MRSNGKWTIRKSALYLAVMDQLRLFAECRVMHPDLSLALPEHEIVNNLCFAAKASRLA